MSAHMPSKNDVQDDAKFALLVAVVGPVSWTLFTIKGLIALRGLLALESLLLFLVIGAITVALLVLSLSLRRAAHRLPPTRLSAEAAAHQPPQTKLAPWVGWIAGAVIWFAIALLSGLGRVELIGALIGLLMGSGLLLIALRRRSRFSSLQALALLSLLGSVVALALDFGVTFSGVDIWTVIVGLGNMVIFWLTALYIVSVGRRRLHQVASVSSLSRQS